MYRQYLEGKSLRWLASHYGYSTHGAVHRELKKHYGPRCCAKATVSLIRSLLADHKVTLDTLGDLTPYLKGTDTYLSNSNLRHLSVYKTVAYDYLPDRVPSPYDPWDAVDLRPRLSFLRLPLYQLILSIIIYELSRLS